MNIMKTSMLLLENNKIRKDDAENTTVPAPIPSTTETKTGMNALMFQGLKNLMEDPNLAKVTGIVKDGENTEENSSNIAFRGGKFPKATKTTTGIVDALAETVTTDVGKVIADGAKAGAKKGEENHGIMRRIANIGAEKTGRKFAQFIPSLIMASTLLPSAMALQSCETEITSPDIHIEIDLSALMSFVTSLQSQNTQLLLNDQIKIDMFNKYMEQTEAWRKQLDQKFANLELIQTSIASGIFEVKNGVIQGFNETNFYQIMIINMLEQFMTRDEAIALFNKIAEHNTSVEAALAEIMKELKLVNQNLGTIIENQNRDYEKQNQIYTVLGMIKGDTGDMRNLAKAQYLELKSTHNSIIEGNNSIVSQISHLRGDMNAGFAATTDALNVQTSELKEQINKGVMTIVANNNWTASMIIAAENYQTQIIKEGQAKEAEAYAKFEAHLITAEELSKELIAIGNEINSKVGALLKNFNDYASNMKKAAAVVIKEIKTGNKTTAELRDLLKDVIANQQGLFAMAEIINQNIEKVDVDMNAGSEAFAKQMGCSTAQIISTLQWLGYSQAQINSWIAANNTAAIINAIKGASNSIVGASNSIVSTLVTEIEKVLDMMDQGIISNEEGNAQIAALLGQVAADVSAIRSEISELNAKFDALTAKVDAIKNYARANYYENKYQSGVVTNIAGSLKEALNDIKDINTTEKAILDRIENGDQLTAEEMELIAMRLNGNIQDGLGGIAALLRTDIAQNEELINIGSRMTTQLNKLGTLSQGILYEIANMGDNLEGLQGISDKVDALVEAFNNYTAKFEKYAESALNAHAQQIAYLQYVQANSDKLVVSNRLLNNKIALANIQLNSIDNSINNLRNIVTQFQSQMGRPITGEELLEILTNLNNDNKAYYAELIGKTNLNPQDYTDALDYIKDLINILITGQGRTNEILAELLDLAKKYPQYKDQIIEAINNITIKVTCQHDCEHNETVHEGVMTIIQ